MRCRVTRETFAYNFGDFASDIGGLSGLFLGISIWGLFSALKRYLERFGSIGKCFKTRDHTVV